MPGIYDKVERAEHVVVRYFDVEGREQTIEADGLLAVCLQHEMDHLDGRVSRRTPFQLKQVRTLRPSWQSRPGSRHEADFAGTPEFAAQALDAILAGHEVALVLTQPDRPSGRGMALRASLVKERALAAGIEVFQPPTLRDAAAQERVRAVAAEAMAVAAYGLILPQTVLDMPRFGCINIHASLLPRWRGAPIQRAILAGDDETGICIMQMEAGLDTGPVLLSGTLRQ